MNDYLASHFNGWDKENSGVEEKCRRHGRYQWKTIYLINPPYQSSDGR